MTLTSLNTRKISLIALFAALYVVLGYVPISVFIGAPSFLSLNLIVTPVIAYIFLPNEAFVSSLIGAVIAYLLNPSQAMFGLPTILLPIAGAYFGSNAVHNKKTGKIISAGFLVIAISLYLSRNYSDPLFVLPHSVALLLLIISLKGQIIPVKILTPILSFISTMCEQGMMMIFAVYILGLPGIVFNGILPMMIYERLVATLGASLLITGIYRSMPGIFKEQTVQGL